eukprot:12841546-Alexandrium_andersonii.AAC.1
MARVGAQPPAFLHAHVCERSCSCVGSSSSSAATGNRVSTPQQPCVGLGPWAKHSGFSGWGPWGRGELEMVGVCIEGDQDGMAQA